MGDGEGVEDERAAWEEGGGARGEEEAAGELGGGSGGRGDAAPGLAVERCAVVADEVEEREGVLSEERREGGVGEERVAHVGDGVESSEEGVDEGE